MPPKGAPTRMNPIRLQTVQNLRIRRPDQAEPNPCLGAMTAVLTCWAGQGYSVPGCAAVEQTLRECMDAPKPPPKAKSSINYHLARLYPKISGPKRRKGSLG